MLSSNGDALGPEWLGAIENGAGSVNISLLIGFGFFVTGLALSHLVLFATRGTTRKKQELSKRQKTLMWASVAMVLIGFFLGIHGFLDN